MSCLSFKKKRPANVNTKKADSTTTIWTNECNENGQFPSTGESKSRSLDAQLDVHMAIAGIPDTRMTMMTNKLRFFLVRFIILLYCVDRVSRPFRNIAFWPRFNIRFSCCSVYHPQNIQRIPFGLFSSDSKINSLRLESR